MRCGAEGNTLPHLWAQPIAASGWQGTDGKGGAGQDLQQIPSGHFCNPDRISASHPAILTGHCFLRRGLGRTLSTAAKMWQKLRGFLRGCLQVKENLRGKEAALIALGGLESSQ